jgi:hypothetical protein
MRRRVLWNILAVILALVVSLTIAHADDVPITGTVKAVDPVTSTMTVQSAAKGTIREVIIHVRPDTRIVRFTRAGDGKFAFTEQAATLADIRPGWTVSVTTHHEGDKEVAQLVRVLHEK